MNETKNDQKNHASADQPISGPKVLNFSPQKNPKGSLFHKKSFLIGLILTVVLGIGALITGYFFIQQRITTPPQAASNVNPDECKKKVSFIGIESSNSTPSGTVAFVKGKVQNKCKKDVTLYMNAFWCSDIKEPIHTCGDNKRVPTATVIIPAGKTKKFSIEQKIGNKGTCGSAQVDVYFVRGANSVWPIANGGAWGDKKSCDEQPACISLDETITGKLQVKAGMTFHYGKFVTHYQFDWGDGKISTVAASKDPAQNTASHTYSSFGTYLIKGGAIVNSTQLFTSDACKANVTFTEVTKYRSCDANNACTQTECPAGETCTDTCDPTKPNPCGSKFNDCVNETCVKNDCPAGQVCPNKCSLTDPNACKTPTKYHVCSSLNACEERTCPIGQTCTSTCDPSKTNPCGSTFTQCSGESCVAINCPVGTSCQSTCDLGKANSCKTFKHSVCQNSACVQKDCPTRGVDCALSSDCQSDSSCVIVRTYQHSVCVNESCVRVDCSPNTQACGNECTSNANCRTAPPPPIAVVQTHKECQNKACVVVNGAGTDQCSSDVSCRPVATPPAIPKSGSTGLTVVGIFLGIGAVAAGLLLAL
jgi:hypothetical protein